MLQFERYNLNVTFKVVQAGRWNFEKDC